MTIQAHLHRAQGALTTLSNGRHSWTADVGKTLGSNDAAPDPHDLLDSALAACTALTLELYIRRKGWNITTLHVGIEHEEAKTADGRVSYTLKRTVQVEGEISAEDKARLMEIANKCPIHRILQGEIHIDTNFA